VISRRNYMDKKAIFPSAEYVEAIKEKLNTDERYAKIAQNWEGDMRLILEPDGSLHETMWLYLDLFININRTLWEFCQVVVWRNWSHASVDDT
jgi:hypothetical protein